MNKFSVILNDFNELCWTRDWVYEQDTAILSASDVQQDAQMSECSTKVNLKHMAEMNCKTCLNFHFGETDDYIFYICDGREKNRPEYFTSQSYVSAAP